jgi:hypothetical protein
MVTIPLKNQFARLIARLLQRASEIRSSKPISKMEVEALYQLLEQSGKFSLDTRKRLEALIVEANNPQAS